MVTQHLKKLFSKNADSTLTVSLTNTLGDDQHIYSTNDTIRGNVIVSLQNDLKRSVSFIGLDIALVGQVTIVVENLHPWANGRTSKTKVHTFLAKQEPRTAKDIRNVYRTEGTVRYETGFEFVVPDKLLPSACKHDENGESQVIDSHIHLPPTFTATDSSMTETVKITYTIRVRARIKTNEQTKTAEAELPVRITPVSDGRSSISLPRYTLQSSSRVDENFLDLCRGRISSQVKQPLALHEILSRQRDIAAAVSMLEIDTHFDPFDPQSPPPHTITIQNKLHAYTYTSLTPFESEPTPEDFADYSPGRTLYHSSISLVQHDFGTIEWQREKSGSLNPIYTTSLHIPIALATDSASSSKFLVPTFSSCLVSHQYVLETRISYCYTTSAGKREKKNLTTRTPLRVYITSARSEKHNAR